MSQIAELIKRVEGHWRQVPGYPYEASATGELRSMRTGLILRPSTSPTGYLKVTFSVDKKRKDIRVHRAVYEAWREPLGDLQVNHLDGNKRNNAIENLEATDALGNVRHALATGLSATGDRHWTRRHKWHVRRGERVKNARLTEGLVRSIRDRRAGGETLTSIAADLGIDKGHVWQVVSRRIWKHV